MIAQYCPHLRAILRFTGSSGFDQGTWRCLARVGFRSRSAPMALTVSQAEAMLAEAEKAGVKHYINHNYRRCPAVQLACQMIDEDKIGRIFHWRGAYQQGRKNHNSFEIYGSNGSLAFNLERMNELQYFSRVEPGYSQGFRTILVTEPSHPYIANWWPPGHIIGYEHTFVHAVVDFIRAIDTNSSINPNFADGLKTMKVLEAGLTSAATGKKLAVN
jgi:predicted dehydrogenase